MKRRNIVIILAVISVLSVTFAFAAENASYYLSNYDAYLVDQGGGEVEVWFDVTGTGMMDEIGVHEIEISEKNGSVWSIVESYSSEDPDYEYLISEDDFFHGTCVTYQGTVGKQYYATVVFYAGKDGGGDERVLDTQIITLE